MGKNPIEFLNILKFWDKVNLSIVFSLFSDQKSGIGENRKHGYVFTPY